MLVVMAGKKLQLASVVSTFKTPKECKIRFNTLLSASTLAIFLLEITATENHKVQEVHASYWIIGLK